MRGAPHPRRLYPRHHIDIAPAELLHALERCAIPPRDAIERLEAFVSPEGSVLAALSVRSAFDAMLTALALPRGSEVLLSGFTIPDMGRLVRAHGLVPVPLDCELGTLAPTVATVERAISPRAKVLVVAQLFGGRAELGPLVALARRAGLLFVDDDAQGFTGVERLAPSSEADVVLHSFGSIKSATALGGALARVRDDALRERMRSVMRPWPAQPARAYAKKIATHLSLGRVVEPARYAALSRALALSGRDIDPVVTKLMRGFPRDNEALWLAALRHRPSPALCETLLSRLRHPTPGRTTARREAGERMLAGLANHVPVLGHAMAERTHWLFAILTREADRLVPLLRYEGFDAARGTSTINAVETAPERPELRATQCASWQRDMLFLPAYPEVPVAERDRLAAVLRRELGAR